MYLRTRSLYAIALVMNSATGVVVVAAPLLAIRFGANALELGLLGSLGALVYTVTCLYAGRFSDAGDGGSRRRRFIILSCASLLAVDAGIFLVKSLGGVFAIAIAGCFCVAFFWPTLQAWVAETEDGVPLSRRLSGFNLSWSLGIMAGPIVGGFLFAADYRLPWCYGLAASAFILVLMSAGREKPGAGAAEAAAGGGADEQGEGSGFLRAALWANFVCWFSLANAQAIYPKLAIARGLSPQIIGYLLFLVGAVQSVVFVLLGMTSRWHYRYLPLAFFHAVAAAGMLVIFSASSVPALSCAFPLLGMALGLSYSSSIYYSLNRGGSRGRRTGIHEFVVGSGFLVGPLAGGVCAQFITLRAPFLLCAVLLAATAAVEGVLAFRKSIRIS